MLRKHTLLSRREASFFMEEKESMVLGRHSQWITKLYSTFQDSQSLYLLMEFVQGGSLGSYLNSIQQPLSEIDSRFYAIEMLLAIQAVHDLGFLHRYNLTSDVLEILNQITF
jgi:protein-serine/threonine kinase